MMYGSDFLKYVEYVLHKLKPRYICIPNIFIPTIPCTSILGTNFGVKALEGSDAVFPWRQSVLCCAPIFIRPRAFIYVVENADLYCYMNEKWGFICYSWWIHRYFIDYSQRMIPKPLDIHSACWTSFFKSSTSTAKFMQRSSASCSRVIRCVCVTHVNSQLTLKASPMVGQKHGKYYWSNY